MFHVRCRLHGARGAALLSATVVLTGGLAPGGAAAASRPAADCQPYSGRACLFPYPDNRFTRLDRSSATGRRVQLPAAAMPANTQRQRIAVGPWDRNDGFSPGSAILLHIPGLDTEPAMRRTGAVPLVNMSRTFARRQPVLLIDEATGRRQLIWSELDANAPSPATRSFVIHPGKALLEGHTYIVALRFLRTAAGRPIGAPRWFARLRQGRRLFAAERSQRRRYARIFRVLAHAGVARNSLYEAWDFTVASTRNLTGRMLAIRNDAFGQLGDHRLADSVPEGAAPAYTISSSSTLPAVSGVNGTVTAISGSYTVPCYLLVCGPDATPGFHYSSHRIDATPTRLPATRPRRSSNASCPARPVRPTRPASRSTATVSSAPTAR